MKNPFFLKPLPLSAPFCDREKELKDLVKHAENSADVVLSSPRRYGKTSLVKRAQNNLYKKGIITVYVDFFGVTSIEDVAAKLAVGIYSVIYKKDTIFKKAINYFSSLRPVIRPDSESGVAITVEITKGKTGSQLLEDTMKGFSEFLKSGKISCNIALDEFQEITELKDSGAIEGIMRAYIQDQQNVSYFFIGSRRRILLDIFNNEKRPFYKSAIHYSLPPLPYDGTVKYLLKMFKVNGKDCPEIIAGNIYKITEGYPYYIQKLSYYTFEVEKEKVSEKNLQEGVNQLLAEETPLFEMMLQNLHPGQVSFLVALAKEPTGTPFNTDYLNAHNLGSLGGVQSAIKKLLLLDYIERTASSWKVVDPIFTLWLKRK